LKDAGSLFEAFGPLEVPCAMPIGWHWASRGQLKVNKWKVATPYISFNPFLFSRLESLCVVLRIGMAIAHFMLEEQVSYVRF